MLNRTAVGLSRGSIHQRAQEFVERWILATSARMTVEQVAGDSVYPVKALVLKLSTIINLST